MNRVQFIIVTALSGIVAFCILLQIIFVRLSAADEVKLRQVSAALQEGQNDFNHLQQIATRVAQLAQQQNDDQLRQVLIRNNIQIKGNASTNAPAASSTTTTPSSTSTH